MGHFGIRHFDLSQSQGPDILFAGSLLWLALTLAGKRAFWPLTYLLWKKVKLWCVYLQQAGTLSSGCRESRWTDRGNPGVEVTSQLRLTLSAPSPSYPELKSFNQHKKSRGINTYDKRKDHFRNFLMCDFNIYSFSFLQEKHRSLIIIIMFCCI